MTTLATAFHEHLRSRATVVLSTRWAKNATTSSKSLVWRAPGRAHGTRSLQTRLHRGQRSRRISPSRNSLQAPRSRWRQRRTEVSKVARVEKPQGHVSRLKRRRRPTTMPAGVKLTSATVAPGMANILLNAVVARTRPPRSRFAVVSSETYGSGIFPRERSATKTLGLKRVERSPTAAVAAGRLRRYRVALAFEAEARPSGGAHLATETRVADVDFPFRMYWLIVGPFSAVIRRRWLRAVARGE